MNPPIRVRLSEHFAARLDAAASRSGATKSMLIEAALDRFLDPDGNVDDIAAVARCLTALSRQVEHLNHDLAIVRETVALHARFHLAVTPAMPIEAQSAACALGAERFEEFATQVGCRVDREAPLMRGTIERLRAARPDRSTGDTADVNSRGTRSTDCKLDPGASTRVDEPSAPTAAAREDGSSSGFPAGAGGSFH
jgi:predicted transcriptional regulator